MYKKNTVSVYCEHYREIKNFPLTIVGSQEFVSQIFNFNEPFLNLLKVCPRKKSFVKY